MVFAERLCSQWLFFTEQAPWQLAKDEASRSRLETVLSTAAEGLRALAQGLDEYRGRPVEQRVLVEMATHIVGRGKEVNALVFQALASADALVVPKDADEDSLRMLKEQRALIVELDTVFVVTAPDAAAALAGTVAGIVRHPDSEVRREMQVRFLSRFPESEKELAAALQNNSIPYQNTGRQRKQYEQPAPANQE